MEWERLILGLFGVLATILGAYMAYRGTHGSTKADALAKAASLYSDYADKMSERADKLDLDMAQMKQVQKETTRTLEETTERLEVVEKDAKHYKSLISEVILWITELLEWEGRDYADPAPRMSLAAILAHLTSTLDQGSRDHHAMSDRAPRPHRGTRRSRRGTD